MEIVVLDGVEYMKVSAAAKHFRYTSDYLGQLCRAKKLDCRLVGRTWYVNPESIAEHKQARYQKQRSNTKDKSSVTDTASKQKASRTKTKPVPNTKKPKQAQPAPEIQPDTGATLRVSYQRDGETLIPLLRKHKQQAAQTIRIEPAQATPVEVAGSQKETTFSAEDLPSVPLSGKLQVTSFPDKASYDLAEKTEVNERTDDTTKKKKDISDKRAKKRSSKGIKIKLSKRAGTKGVTTSSAAAKQHQTTSGDQETQANRPATIEKPSKQQSLKTQKKTTSVSFTPTAVQSAASSTRLMTVVRISPLIATFAAVLVGALLWSASTQVLAFGSTYESKVLLQTANLLELLNSGR